MIAAAPRGVERGRNVQRSIHVGHLAAAGADEVVMLLDARIPQRGAAAGGETLHDAELLEELEGRIDRGQRRVGQALRDSLQHLLGREVPVEIEQRPVDQHALRGHPHAAFAQGRRELVVRRSH